MYTEPYSKKLQFTFVKQKTPFHSPKTIILFKCSKRSKYCRVFIPLSLPELVTVDVIDIISMNNTSVLPSITIRFVTHICSHFTSKYSLRIGKCSIHLKSYQTIRGDSEAYAFVKKRIPNFKW